MIGPVLMMELVLGSRRGHLDLWRRMYAGWLALQFGVTFLNYLSRLAVPGSGVMDPRIVSDFVTFYCETFVLQHFLLLLLATPPFVAGAISDDKARGTLQGLLIADVTSWEIVVGKLLGRLAQVAYVALAGLPLIAFMGGYGDLAWSTLLALVIVSAAILFGLGAASILASVWCRQSRSAVLCVYFVAGAAFLMLTYFHAGVAQYLAPKVKAGVVLQGTEALLWQLDGLLHCLAPLHVLEPAWVSHHLAEVAWRLLIAVLAWGSFGMVCVGLAVWRLRPAYVRQLEHPVRRKANYLIGDRPPVDDDPIRWKERVVEGMAIVPMLRRVPRWIGWLLVFLGTIVFSWPLAPGGVYAGHALLVLLVACLLVGIRSSGAICGEREQQTWEALLVTPVENWEIIRDKHWGILQAAYPYLAAYALPTLLLCATVGASELLGTSVVLVATALLMYFMAAVGVECSVRSQSSWRALLATLLIGYGYGLCLTFFCMAVFVPFACLIALPSALLGAFVGVYQAEITALIVATAFCLWITRFLLKMAHLQLHQAEKWLEKNERAESTLTTALTRALRKYADRGRHSVAPCRSPWLATTSGKQPSDCSTPTSTAWSTATSSRTTYFEFRTFRHR